METQLDNKDGKLQGQNRDKTLRLQLEIQVQ
jgi:hypothetical protein